MTNKNPNWKKFAFPPEHGSWGLTIEPILLGLLSAPSWAGLSLAFGAFALFLLRWPFKMARKCYRKSDKARLKIALRFVILYAAVASIGLLSGVYLANFTVLWPLAAALPFGLIFYRYDAQNRSRSWQAEIAGPIAFAAVAASLALAGGMQNQFALSLWVVLAARVVPSIFYVRSRIRLDRGKPHQPWLAWLTGIVALAVVSKFSKAELLPSAAVYIFYLLLLRSIIGLSKFRREVPIKVVGISEMLWGFATVLVVALAS